RKQAREGRATRKPTQTPAEVEINAAPVFPKALGDSPHVYVWPAARTRVVRIRPLKDLGHGQLGVERPPTTFLSPPSLGHGSGTPRPLATSHFGPSRTTFSIPYLSGALDRRERAWRWALVGPMSNYAAPPQLVESVP